MKKIAVIYWSGTGNTEAMARAAAEGARKTGAETALLRVDEADASTLAAYDGLLFGCPAMGAEVLEESEFEPFFAAAEDSLAGKKTGLFGSYGWGGGAWMKDWEERVRAAGADLVADGVTTQNAPDEAALAACEALGEAIAR